MEFFNVFGLIFVLIILVPNIVYSIYNKNAEKIAVNSRAIDIIENIGRFGCIAFMIINVPGTFFGWWSDEAFAVYLIVDALICVVYCVLFVILWKKHGKFKAAVLSVLPSVLFLFSGIMSRSIPLIVFALIFAVTHIWISVKNADYI